MVLIQATAKYLNKACRNSISTKHNAWLCGCLGITKVSTRNTQLLGERATKFNTFKAQFLGVGFTKSNTKQILNCDRQRNLEHSNMKNPVVSKPLETRTKVSNENSLRTISF